MYIIYSDRIKLYNSVIRRYRKMRINLEKMMIMIKGLDKVSV